MGSVVSNLFGGDTGADEMEAANRLTEEQIARLEAIGIPSIEAQRIALESPQLVGLLQAEALGPSAFEQVQEDPRLKSAQMSALQEMIGLTETGLGAEDLAAFNELRRKVAAQAQAQRATALQQMQERGMANSGIAAVSDLQAGQQAANMLVQQAENQAAQAAAARRSAIGQQANMATQMQQQGLQLAGQKASAKDVINQFNVQNRQNVAARNLAERQRIAEAGTATANQQQMYNAGLLQQQFQNELAKATGQGAATQNLAGQYMGQAQAAQQAQQAGTGSLLNLAGTLGAAYMTKKV